MLKDMNWNGTVRSLNDVLNVMTTLPSEQVDEFMRALSLWWQKNPISQALSLEEMIFRQAASTKDAAEMKRLLLLFLNQNCIEDFHVLFHFDPDHVAPTVLKVRIIQKDHLYLQVLEPEAIAFAKPEYRADALRVRIVTGPARSLTVKEFKHLIEEPTSGSSQ